MLTADSKWKDSDLDRTGTFIAKVIEKVGRGIRKEKR